MNFFAVLIPTSVVFKKAGVKETTALLARAWRVPFGVHLVLWPGERSRGGGFGGVEEDEVHGGDRANVEWRTAVATRGWLRDEFTGAQKAALAWGGARAYALRCSGKNLFFTLTH